MTTTSATETGDAVALVLALVLADVLGLDLPAPGYITISPFAAHSLYVAAIDFQFDGDQEAVSVRAWADWFGAQVSIAPATDDRGEVWVSAEFTYSDTRFKVYARTAASKA